MIDKAIKNWLDFLKVNSLLEKVHNRHIYLWGAYEQSAIIAKELKRRNVLISGYVESKKKMERFMDAPVISPEELGAPQEVFVIIPVKSRIDEIVEQLENKQFTIMKDYLVIRNQQLIQYNGGYYEDVFGNRIISGNYDVTSNMTVEFNGYNNTIIIGRNVTINDTKLLCEYGSTISIGAKCKVSNSFIKCTEKGVLDIGDKCVLTQCDWYSKSSVVIGDQCTFSGMTTIGADVNSPVTIGKDCMFAWPVYIRSNNAHALLDLENRENTSLTKEHFVRIGNHVWIGQNVNILFNADIEDNSVIGAGSMVNKSFPANCVIAGNPAKIVKENHSWARKFAISFEEFENG